jgi:hypothetical protein
MYWAASNMRWRQPRIKTKLHLLHNIHLFFTMKKAYLIIRLLLLCVIIYNCSTPKGISQNPGWKSLSTRIFDSTPSVEYLNPEQMLKSFNLPGGFHLEL